MSKKRLFFLSVVVTAAVLVVKIYLNRPGRNRPELVAISDGVFLTSQLQPAGIPYLRKDYQIKTVVDFRPDGEAADQPSSAQIASSTRRYSIDFHYIPVPHESIPDDAVAGLSEVLSPDALPAVLYCRTGRRAVRTFALARASQADGPGLEAIMEMVRAAGFAADDLKSNIAERIAHRSSPPTLKN